MLTIIRVARNGRQFDCWLTGGVHKLITPPSPPFFYNTARLGEPIFKRLLGNMARGDSEKKRVWKRTFRNVHELRRLRGRYEKGIVMESGVRYKERIAQDFGFLQTDMHTTDATFDIEIETTGQFPKVSVNPITAIAYFSRHYQKVWTKFDFPEYEIISQLCDHAKKDNIDVFGTFSGTALDYEYPKDRAKILGVDFSLGRLGDAPYTQTRTWKTGKRIGVEKTTFLQGRVCYDLYREVLFDTSLSGVRHTLKDTCRFLFGDDYIVEVDRQRMDALSREELGAYCFSDARITFKLLQHYLAVMRPLAKVLKVPLDMICFRKPSHIGNLVYGRAFNKLDIISDGSNVDRFMGLLWSSEQTG